MSFTFNDIIASNFIPISILYSFAWESISQQSSTSTLTLGCSSSLLLQSLVWLNRGLPELWTVLGKDAALVWEWEVKTQQIEKNTITGIKFDTVLSVNVNNLIIYWKIPNLYPFKPSCSSDQFIFKRSWKNLCRKKSIAVRMKKIWELFIY